MILEAGKYYKNRNNEIYGPMEKHANWASNGWMLASQLNDSSNFKWFFNSANGRRIIDMHDLTSKNHLTEEYIEKSSETSDKVTPIDQVKYEQLQRGVAAIWDSYKIYY